MDQRRQSVLAMAVEHFINSNRPVASKDLAHNLGVSSATVRNEFAALEELGFLAQPHTSAGRVPTREAYKMYARKFVPPSEIPEATLPETTRHNLQRAIGSSGGESRLRVALRFASRFSGYAAVAVVAPNQAVLEATLLSVLSDGRILAVVVLLGGITREFIFDAGFKPERSTLDKIENALRQQNLPLKDVPAALLQLEQTASPAISSLAKALRNNWNEVQPTIVMSEGASAILGEPESNDPVFLRQLLELLERPIRKSSIAPGKLSLEVDDPSGISGIEVGFSSNAGMGSFTILGPIRMRYPQAIAVAKAVSDAVSDAG